MGKRGTVCLLLGVSMLFGMQHASSAGTPAGTEIVNVANVTYDVGPTVGLQIASGPVVIKVAEILDLTVLWMDAVPVRVLPGATDEVLTFEVTNTGNGVDSYELAVDAALGGDQFDPLFQSIYLDTGDGVFDPATDTLYTQGVNDPELDANDAAGRQVTVFVLCDIPGDTLDTQLGHALLRATYNTGTGPRGTVLEDGGDGDTPLVIGDSGGTAADTGTYHVQNFEVAAVKAVEISHPDIPNLDAAIPGATLTYTIRILPSGEQTATDVVFSDPIPAQTTYAPGTLSLNGNGLTDGADGDAGDVGATTPGVVTVTLGQLTGTDGEQTIRFQVKVN